MQTSNTGSPSSNQHNYDARIAVERRNKVKKVLHTNVKDFVDVPDANEIERLGLIEEIKIFDHAYNGILKRSPEKLRGLSDLVNGHGVLEVNYVQAMEDFTRARHELTAILEFKDPVMRGIVRNVASCAELSRYNVSCSSPTRT